MLNLYAGVDFDEVHSTVGVYQEFDRAGVVVAYRLAELYGIAVQVLLHILGQGDAGGHFDHFLEAPLHGAVAFEQVDQVAVPVA